MVAELTETSRLFGRVAARIQPEWVEPLAQHVLKRSWSDPRWSKKAGAVLARITSYNVCYTKLLRILTAVAFTMSSRIWASPNNAVQLRSSGTSGS